MKNPELHKITTFDGEDFIVNNGRDKFILSPTPGNFGFPSVRWKATRPYFEYGKRVSGFNLNSRILRLDYLEQGQSRDDLFSNRANVLDILHPRRGGDLTYTFIREDGTQRAINGRATGPQFPGTGESWQEWDIDTPLVIECFDPIWFNPTPVTVIPPDPWATPTKILDPDWVSYWRYEDSNDLGFDSQGLNNLVNDNSVLQTAGKVGDAAAFVRASAKKLRIDDADQTGLDFTGDMSLVAWARISAGGIDQVVMGKFLGGLNQNNYVLRIEAGLNRPQFIVFHDGVTATIVTSPTTLTLNTWYLLFCYHRDGVEIGVSVNAGTPTTTPHTLGIWDSVVAFTIGARANGVNAFDGDVDEGAAIGRVLGLEEVDYIYNLGVGQLYSSLVSLYNGDCLVFPETFPICFGVGSKPFIITATYAGTWFTRPTFTLTGPCSSVILYHAGLDKTITYPHRIAAGETLTLDLDAQTLISSVDSADYWTQISEDSDIDGFRIEHDNVVADGINTIIATFADATDDTTIQITYIEKYLGI